MTSTRRTHEQQACLLARAAAGDPNVYRPALHSQHERGLAFDVELHATASGNAEWSYFSAHDWWEANGGAPATPGDPVHFQPIINPGGLEPEAG